MSLMFRCVGIAVLAGSLLGCEETSYLVDFVSGDRADDFVWIECEDDDAECIAMVDQKVAKGVLSESQAERLRKTMLGADKRKERLERMNEDLFDQ